MKIGAGGLQSLASQEILPLRRIEPAGTIHRENTFPQGASVIEKGGLNQEDLIKAVGRLNQAAEAYNQPLEFLVKEEQERLTVQLVDKESREVQAEIPPANILAAAHQPLKTIGLLIDLYL